MRKAQASKKTMAAERPLDGHQFYRSTTRKTHETHPIPQIRGSINGIR